MGQVLGYVCVGGLTGDEAESRGRAWFHQWSIRVPAKEITLDPVSSKGAKAGF